MVCIRSEYDFFGRFLADHLFCGVLFMCSVFFEVLGVFVGFLWGPKSGVYMCVFRLGSFLRGILTVGIYFDFFRVSYVDFVDGCCWVWY